MSVGQAKICFNLLQNNSVPSQTIQTPIHADSVNYYMQVNLQILIIQNDDKNDPQTFNTVLRPEPLFLERALAFMLGGQKEQVGLLGYEEIQCSRDHLRENNVNGVNVQRGVHVFVWVG